MKHLKVSMKLFLSFIIVAILTGAAGIVGIIGLSNMNDAASEMYDSAFLAIDSLAELRENFVSQRNAIRDIFLSQNDAEKVQSLIEEIHAYDEEALVSFAEYEAAMSNPEEQQAYYDAKDAWLGLFANVKNAMFEQINAGDFDGAYITFTVESQPVIAPLQGGLQEAGAMHDQSASKLNDSTTDLFTVLLYVLIGLVAIALLAAIGFAFYISALISKPLITVTSFMQQAGTSGDIALRPEDVENISQIGQRRDELGSLINATASFVQHVTEASTTLEAVASGDLTVELTPLSDKDTLGVSLQKMNGNLNAMFKNINASSGQVSAGASQVADGSQALAQGATEQAASIQQLSSSISEVAERTKDNVKKANQAVQLAETIKANAKKGSSQMAEMTQAVKEINEASNSISKVIKTIDDIAFQTNILALNAAVEAARAGQHGKGFAVVAEEVRNLAAKSAEAAKDTESLIANSMQKAEQGVKIADSTATSLLEIVSGIDESEALIAEIARASEEQSLNISQINTGIDQVAQVVQQNSATAEESAAASQEMSSQSAMLKELISTYKIKG